MSLGGDAFIVNFGSRPRAARVDATTLQPLGSAQERGGGGRTPPGPPGGWGGWVVPPPPPRGGAALARGGGGVSLCTGSHILVADLPGWTMPEQSAEQGRGAS